MQSLQIDEVLFRARRESKAPGVYCFSRGRSRLCKAAPLGLALLLVTGLLRAQDSPCDLNGDSRVDVADVQRAINQGVGIESCGGADLNRDGKCDVADVQRFVNASLGQPCQVGDATTNPSKSVLDYGARCDGATDDRVAIQAALNDSAGWEGGTLSFPPSRTCVVSAGLTWFSNNDNRTILGKGSTIKARDGMPVARGFQMLRITSADNSTIDDLDFDANRTNRSPAEVGAHTIEIRGSRGLTLRKVDVRNGVTDGFYISASDPLNLDSFPRDLSFVDCTADNNFRQGMSIIFGRNIAVKGTCDGSVNGTCSCRFTNTNGTPPQAGIDLEPNISATGTPGLDGTLIEGCLFADNKGYGIKVTNTHQGVNGTIIRNNTLRANDGGAFEFSGRNSVVTNNRIGTHPLVRFATAYFAAGDGSVVENNTFDGPSEPGKVLILYGNFGNGTASFRNNTLNNVGASERGGWCVDWLNKHGSLTSGNRINGVLQNPNPGCR